MADQNDSLFWPADFLFARQVSRGSERDARLKNFAGALLSLHWQADDQAVWLPRQVRIDGGTFLLRVGLVSQRDSPQPSHRQWEDRFGVLKFDVLQGERAPSVGSLGTAQDLWCAGAKRGARATSRKSRLDRTPVLRGNTLPNLSRVGHTQPYPAGSGVPAIIIVYRQAERPPEEEVLAVRQIVIHASLTVVSGVVPTR